MTQNAKIARLPLPIRRPISRRRRDAAAPRNIRRNAW